LTKSINVWVFKRKAALGAAFLVLFIKRLSVYKEKWRVAPLFFLELVLVILV
jgi:hypothetical protein